jgi:hypothetical protein
MVDLPIWVRQRLEARHALLTRENRANPVVLAQTLQDHGYPPNPFVTEFENLCGGLEVPEIGLGASWYEAREPAWLFGAYACLTSQAHVHPTGGLPEQHLIPVVYSPNDIIYFLDQTGQAFAQDTIEEPQAAVFAPNALAMVCRIVLWEEIFYFQTLDLALEFGGLHGNQLSKHCNLAPLAAASSTDLTFWGDADVVMVERQPQTDNQASTMLVSRTKKRFKQIQKLCQVL